MSRVSDVGTTTIGKTLGGKIREARSRRCSLRAQAKELRITPSYLSDIENDRRVPAEPVLRRIALSLNLDIDELMATAGRLGEDATRYMQGHHLVLVLVRRLAELDVDDSGLAELSRFAEAINLCKESNP